MTTMIANGYSKMTPAGIAISRATAPKVVAENKQVVRIFLERESAIYELAFQLVNSLDLLNSTDDVILKVFCLFLQAKMVVDVAEEDKIRLFGEPVLKTYAPLARKTSYWQPDKARTKDGLLAFQTLLQSWRKDEEEILIQAEPLFKQFEEALQQ